MAKKSQEKISSHKKFKFEEKYQFPGYETDDPAWLFAKILQFKNEVEEPNHCDIQDKTLVEGGGETAELIDKAILGNDDHLLCELQQSTEEEVSVYETRSKNAPTYNSVLNHSQPLAKVSMPPFIAAPSHEFSTLITIFRQAERNQDIDSRYGPKNYNYLGHGAKETSKTVGKRSRMLSK